MGGNRVSAYSHFTQKKEKCIKVDLWGSSQNWMRAEKKRRQQTPLLNTGEICTGDCFPPLLSLMPAAPPPNFMGNARSVWKGQNIHPKNIRQKAAPFREGEKEKFYGETQELLAEKKDPLLRGGGRVKYPSSYSISFYGKQPSGWWTKKRRERPPAIMLCCCVVLFSSAIFPEKRNQWNESLSLFFFHPFQTAAAVLDQTKATQPEVKRIPCNVYRGTTLSVGLEAQGVRLTPKY